MIDRVMFSEGVLYHCFVPHFVGLVCDVHDLYFARWRMHPLCIYGILLLKYPRWLSVLSFCFFVFSR
jgi:hypothetical protein